MVSTIILGVISTYLIWIQKGPLRQKVIQLIVLALLLGVFVWGDLN